MFVQPYYLPNSVAVAGVAKVVVCFAASVSLFGALIAHKLAPQPLAESTLSPSVCKESLSDNSNF